MKAAPKPQRAMYDEAFRKIAETNDTFLEMLPTMRRRDLERLIEKRPALWGRFAGYLTSGHVFVDDPEGGSKRSHATKKSPAQLQREIDEVIAARKHPTAPLRDAASLHDVWDPSGKRFKLTYLPYHEKHLYPSYSAYGYGSFEEFFADRADAKARAQQLRDEERIEKFEIHEIVRPKTGGTSLRLVDEWDDSESHATKKRQRAHATASKARRAKTSRAPSLQDIREFRSFLQQASERQVQAVFDKETAAGREEYAALAREEAKKRGLWR